jgi:hypothetical protein
MRELPTIGQRHGIDHFEVTLYLPFTYVSHSTVYILVSYLRNSTSADHCLRVLVLYVVYPSVGGGKEESAVKNDVINNLSRHQRCVWPSPYTVLYVRTYSTNVL